MDLQNKYQILASEFSKVRGQVTVLKKAIIDEQHRNEELKVISCFVFSCQLSLFVQGRN